MRVRIGVSGWLYPSWRGVFYPPKLPHARELSYVSQSFDTVELNGSFYSLMRPTSACRWYDATRDDFVFAVKGSRFITHMKRLADVDVALANFFASGVLALREKLGPILWQLPPQTAFDEARLDEFLSILPRTTREAARLARKHDARLEGRDYVTTDADRHIRYALEVRHESFDAPRFFALLRRHGIASCVSDMAGLFPMFERTTADFSYVRLHGRTKRYESRYSARSIARWAERVAQWSRRGDVYVYFDNDAKVHAPFDAQALRAAVDRLTVERRRHA